MHRSWTRRQLLRCAAAALAGTAFGRRAAAVRGGPTRLAYVPLDRSRPVIGLYNVDGEGSYPAYDQGLYEVRVDPDVRGFFRPPSLRNVALTAPYTHDGSIATLREMVEHYAAGGRVIEEGDYAGDGRVSPLKSGLVRGFDATDEEIDAVVAFLESFTDKSFVENPAHSDPFE